MEITHIIKIEDRAYILQKTAYEITLNDDNITVIYVPVESVDAYKTLNPDLNIKGECYNRYSINKPEYYDEATIICSTETNPKLMSVLYANNLCANENYMTLAEAKAVTVITDILNGGNGNEVETFNEFKYFTNVTEIPNNFAANNTTLREITLPLSATSIGQTAFAITSAGEKEGKVSALTKVDGVENIVTVNPGAFQKAGKLQYLNFTNKLTTISGIAAFKECKNMERIGDLSNVTTVGTGSTFMECIKLKQMNFTKKLTSLPNSAFRECHELESVGDLSGVTTMGNTVFYRTYKLKKLNLPNVTVLNQTAIFKANELTELDISKVTRLTNEGAIGDIPLINKINLPAVNQIDKKWSIAFSAYDDKSLNIEINFGLPYSEITFASKSILCDTHHQLFITFNGQPATQEQIEYIVEYLADED